jgi:hypothetical protein
MGEISTAHKSLVGKSERREHSEDLGVDGKILQWIFGKQGGKVWNGCIYP